VGRVRRAKTYSTLAIAVGRTIAFPRTSALRSHAANITECRSHRRSFSLLREIHSTREIAPPLTKRNESRRFYYAALKPSGLALQSYRSKLVPPIPPLPCPPFWNADAAAGRFLKIRRLFRRFATLHFSRFPARKSIGNAYPLYGIRLSRRFLGNGIVCFPLYAGSNGIVRIRNLVSVACAINRISLRCNGCVLCIRRESVSDTAFTGSCDSQSAHEEVNSEIVALVSSCVQSTLAGRLFA